ncbi:MAG: AraC family transcriptional regulator, partial [Rhodospirillales bacterium]|nr:AraC family transcriptional regulator [Rhodospirillales bacterium]
FQHRAIVDGIAWGGTDRMLRRSPGGYLPVFREIGVDPSIVGQHGRKTLFNNYVAYFDTAARHTGDPVFGLHYGAVTRPNRSGIPGYAILNSATFRDALLNFIKTLPVIAEGIDQYLHEDEEVAYYQWALTEETESAHWQYSEYVNAFLLSMFRGFMGRRWVPLEVHYQHPPPGDIRQFRRVFEVPVLFARPINALVIDRKDLNRRNPRYDGNLLKLLLHEAEEELSWRRRPTDPIRTVRTAISQALAQGASDIDYVAERLSMKPRSLQRFLKTHGMGYRELIDEVRFELGRTLLADPSLPMTEIAFRLGYSEVSAFSRAFNRWAGVSPKEYR